jgi:hypothetical protein
METKRIVNGVSGLVPQDSHTFAFAAAFHLDHLCALQLDQPRVGQIERNGEPPDAIGRKPFFRKPDMRPEVQGSSVDFAIELLNPLFQARAFDSQRKIAEPHIQQLPVRHAIQS